MHLKAKIGMLNSEIKSFYFSKKKQSVRKGILPGDSRSLWSAVKIAKDIGTNDIPRNMTCNGVSIAEDKISDSFAQFFEEKVSKITNTAVTDPGVYNGHSKMTTSNGDFIDRSMSILQI